MEKAKPSATLWRFLDQCKVKKLLLLLLILDTFMYYILKVLSPRFLVLVPGRSFWVLAAVILVMAGANARSASDWELKITDAEAGINVYYRTNERGYTEFRAVTQVSSSLGAFVGLFREVDNMPNWVYRTEKVERLKMVGDTEAYAYTINKMPWPLNDRDSIVRSTLSQDPNTLVVTIVGSAVPDYAPRNSQYVRMPVVESFWRFTPLKAGLVEVVFQGYGDPGGSLSSGFLEWITRLSLLEAPYQTLLGLQKVIVRPEYQARKFDFIREPGR